MQAGKFDIETAQRGYALNKMCHSLNVAHNRATFLGDEEAYCTRFDLGEDEKSAVLNRDKPRLFKLGGNMYFLAKLDRVKKAEKVGA